MGFPIAAIAAQAASSNSGGSGGGQGGGFFNTLIQQGDKMAATGVNTTIGALKIASGLIQQRKANKALKNLKRPEYNIQQPILDNNALADIRAQQGMTDAARTVYEDGLDRGLTTSLDAILRGGGTVNNVSDLLDNHQEGAARIAALEEEMRRKNEAVWMQQNQLYAGELDKQWMVNTWEPYRNKLQELNLQKQQAASRVWSGVDQIGATFNQAAQMSQYQGDGRMTGGGMQQQPSVAENIGSGSVAPVQMYQGAGSFMGSSGKFADPAKRNYYGEVAADLARRGF